MLGAQDLRKAYGDREILAGVSVAIEAGERIGLVGSNGSGKSTLARILAGMEQADAGLVTRGNQVTLGYLAQEPAMDPAHSALQVAMSGLAAWTEAMRRHEAATAALADASHGGALDGALAEQAAAAAAIERLGGWELRHRAEAMLGHLGVPATEQLVGTMSGGERRRVAMARVLIAQPSIAILDEPTNHLDVATIDWLEQYLIDTFAGALLLITHDRYLLDRVVTRTLELDRGAVYSYDGGWEDYLAAKAERAAHAERTEANRRNFLRRELEWLRRQPKARTGKQKARIARAQVAIDAPAAQRDAAAALAVGELRSGKTILEAHGLAVDAGGQRLVEDFTLVVRKGERIGVVGPNGAGKTTLLRALLGEAEPAAGTVVRGANTRVAYLDQARAGLTDDASIHDCVAEGRTHITLGDQTMEVRSYLQRFLFEVPAQARLVGTLSGGERARVALARVLRDGANLVVLDEPTNDLDVVTLAALEASLLDFGGTAIVVTHDRWFLDRVATSILGFEGDGRVVHVHGTYADYAAWRARDRAAAAPAPAPAKPAPPPAPAPASGTDAPRKLTFAERRELETLMDRIDSAEAEVAALEARLAAPTFAELDYQQQAGVIDQLQQARARAEALVDRWSELEARSADPSQ